MNLKANDLRKRYGKREVLKGINIELSNGEVVGLLGPNGAGKTTTFYIIVGLIKADNGNIYISDEQITYMPMYQRAKMGIVYLPQEHSVFRKLTVFNNLYSIVEFQNISKQDKLNKVEELMELLKISHLKDSLAYTLSGGEKRRLEIARALILNPKFILLDEPFAGVDPITVESIQEIIKKLKTLGIGILITDHNVAETLSITDRSYIINNGSILIEGIPEQIIKDKTVREIYLGEKFKLYGTEK
jgi:lipopolysaccharide export system ATP-binding protein